MRNRSPLQFAVLIIAIIAVLALFMEAWYFNYCI